MTLSHHDTDRALVEEIKEYYNENHGYVLSVDVEIKECGLLTTCFCFS